MKFKLIIDNTQEEEILARVHARSELTDALETLVLGHSDSERILGYGDDEIKMLSASQMECITVLDGKTYAIDSGNRRYRLKQRLYELEQQLPAAFVRINKSTLARLDAIDRFVATYTGGVDAVFRCGYTEYVSRRCFSQIKRRLEEK